MIISKKKNTKGAFFPISTPAFLRVRASNREKLFTKDFKTFHHRQKDAMLSAKYFCLIMISAIHNTLVSLPLNGLLMNSIHLKKKISK